MQLTFDSGRRRWLAHTCFGETTLPREVGFAWSREQKVWMSSDVRAAARLRDYASADTQALLDAALVEAPPPAPPPPPPPVSLAYNKGARLWEARTAYGSGDVAKAAGMQWERTRGLWITADVTQAARLRSYADPATQAVLDAQVVTAQAAAKAKTERVRQAIEASRATDADIDLPIAAGRSFLPYQRAGIAFALARQNVLIGDDMGLGKTAQAIGVVNADQTLRRVLVICPASLTRNWVREFGFFGSRQLSIGIATTKVVPETDIVICTYDVFSRKAAAVAALLAVEWDALILDEAHYLKNGDAARTLNILGGTMKAKNGEDPLVAPGLQTRRRIYLTGTPIPNRPIELWALAHSLAPKDFGDFWKFARRYCAAHNSGYGWDFSGASNLDELQDKLRSSIMVRRIKKDVLTELPGKRRQIVELPADTPELRAALAAEGKAKEHQEKIALLRAQVELAKSAATPAAYRDAVAALRAGESVPFEEMSAVRHRTALAKAPTVCAHVRDAVEAGGKVIVFAHHQDVVDLLRKELADLGVVVLTGETLPAKRQQAVDDFQARDDVRVFVGNIMAAGVGITLTASSHVVFAELDWVPGNVSQAEDRAHRIGQRDSVLVQHLVLQESIDATMAATIISKQAIIDAALDNLGDPAEREALIVAEQARMDAAVEQAEEALAERLQDKDGHAFKTAATTHLTHADVSEAALALLPETVTAIHAGLRILAGLDHDGARELNGMGYNKVDTHIGRTLAAKASLTAREAALGQRLVRRYRRQLPADLLAAAMGEPAAAVEPAAAQLDPVFAPTIAEMLAAVTSMPQPERAPPPTSVPAAAEPELSPVVVEAVHACLRELTTADSLGRDQAFIWTQAGKERLTPRQALVCRKILARHRQLLPADLAAVAMGEVDPSPRDAAPESVAAVEPVEPTAKRARGRPPKGAAAMTAAERNKAWRASKSMASLEVPGHLADRLRAMRDTRGGSMADLLQAALDALDRQGAVRLAA